MKHRPRREVETKNGLFKCFIYREKKSHTYYLYSGQDFNDPKHQFMMMARYFPALAEFRLYTVNAYKLTQKPQTSTSKAPSTNCENVFKEDQHCAVLYFHKARKHFVLKNRYCLECSGMTVDYFCEPAKQWLFQQELAYFYIVSPSLEVKWW